MKVKKILILSSVLAISSPVTNAAESYIGADALMWDNFGTSVQAVYGLNVQDRIGLSLPLFIELRGGTSIADENGLEINNHFGAFVKGEYSLSPLIDLYALGGIAYSKYTVELFGFKSSYSDTGLAFGGGIKYKIGADWSINAEFNSYDVNLFSVGLRKEF